MGFARLRGQITAGRESARLVQLNRMAARFSAYSGTRDGVTLFTPWMGDTVPADSTARRTVREMTGDGRELTSALTSLLVDVGALQHLVSYNLRLQRDLRRAWEHTLNRKHNGGHRERCRQPCECAMHR